MLCNNNRFVLESLNEMDIGNGYYHRTCLLHVANIRIIFLYFSNFGSTLCVSVTCNVNLLKVTARLSFVLYDIISTRSFVHTYVSTIASKSRNLYYEVQVYNYALLWLLICTIVFF